jgi:hypothetical protein
MARYLGDPLIENGEAVKVPPSASTQEGLRLRRALDDAWGKAGTELKMSPAEVQEAMWDNEQKLWQRYGAPASSGSISDGVRTGISRLIKGEKFSEYEAGRPATKQESDTVTRWKALSELRRVLFKGTEASSGTGAVDNQVSGLRGYTRNTRQSGGDGGHGSLTIPSLLILG